MLTIAPLILNHKSTFTLKIVLANSLLTFHHKSTLTLKFVLASALWTFNRKSLHCWLHPIWESSPLWHGSLFVAQSSCSCEHDTATGCHTSCCAGHPLWCSFCSESAIRWNTSYWIGSHSTLSYLVCGTSSCSTELVLATRCHLIKINLVLFPVTVLRSLSFLIIIIIIKRGWQCKAGRERLTPYQSEDPNPTTPTHRKKEKGKQ